MRAILHTRYGPPDVLQFAQVEKPAPKENEVLIKLFATSVNPLDLFSLRGTPLLRSLPGMRTPKHPVLGCDIAGRVESIGENVKQFRPGDDVFGATGFAGGAFAEYVCAPEHQLAPKPANCSFEEAASLPVAGVTALQGLRDYGHVQPGQKVLIDGASGGVGTFALQIAKSFGAEVTAVCSTNKMDIARSLGADHVIDYTRENFTKSAHRYDLILGANAHHSLFTYLRALTRQGTYVAVGGGMPQILQALLLARLLSRTGGKKACFFIAKINRENLSFLKDLVEAGKLRPVIDRRFPLSQAAEALRYLELHHAQGKVVLTAEPGTCA
jgi:NADPH:quinone reductase-like Zn-dependent oxidoreductase